MVGMSKKKQFDWEGSGALTDLKVWRQQEKLSYRDILVKLRDKYQINYTVARICQLINNRYKEFFCK